MDMQGTISNTVHKVYVAGSQEELNGQIPMVGSRCSDSLGRSFVFVSMAVDAVAGQVVSSAAVPARLDNVVVAAVAGSTTIKIVKSGVTANQYADGLLVAASGANQTSYAIKKNTASATVSSVANTVILTLINPIDVAIAATDDCFLILNRHTVVVIGTALSDGVGVVVAPSTAATSGKTNYLWVQCGGLGAVKVGTGASLTTGAAFGLGAAGVVDIIAAHGTPSFGYSVAPAAVGNGECVAAQLQFPGVAIQR